MITSASDIGGGGIAVALARATIPNAIGAKVELIPIADGPFAAAYFGETAGTVIVTCPHYAVEQVREMAFSFEGLNIFQIGETTGSDLVIHAFELIAANSVEDIRCSVDELREAYSGTLTHQITEEVFA